MVDEGLRVCFTTILVARTAVVGPEESVGSSTVLGSLSVYCLAQELALILGYCILSIIE